MLEPLRNMPASLQGRAILVTSPWDSAQRMAVFIRQRGGVAVLAPLVARVPLPITNEMAKVFTRLAEYRWLIFTSGGAVERFFDETKKRNTSCRFDGAAIAAIGGRTRERIEQQGFRVSVVAQETCADGLAAAMIAHGLAPGDRALFPCAENARPVLCQEMLRRGVRVEALPLYTIAPQTPANWSAVPDLLHNQALAAIAFTSPSAVWQFVSLFSLSEWLRLARKKGI